METNQGGASFFIQCNNRGHTRRAIMNSIERFFDESWMDASDGHDIPHANFQAPPKYGSHARSLNPSPAYEDGSLIPRHGADSILPDALREVDARRHMELNPMPPPPPNHKNNNTTDNSTFRGFTASQRDALLERYSKELQEREIQRRVQAELAKHRAKRMTFAYNAPAYEDVPASQNRDEYGNTGVWFPTDTVSQHANNVDDGLRDWWSGGNYSPHSAQATTFGENTFQSPRYMTTPYAQPYDIRNTVNMNHVATPENNNNNTAATSRNLILGQQGPTTNNNTMHAPNMTSVYNNNNNNNSDNDNDDDDEYDDDSDDDEDSDDKEGGILGALNSIPMPLLYVAVGAVGTLLVQRWLSKRKN